jgi:hypothetical protein
MAKTVAGGSSFGLGASLGGRSALGGRGGMNPFGGGLAEFGQDEEKQAGGELSFAAQQENTRNLANQKLEAEGKAGMAKLGSTLGAIAGNAIAPGLGGVIGGTLGGLAGSAFAVCMLVANMPPGAF